MDFYSDVDSCILYSGKSSRISATREAVPPDCILHQWFYSNIIAHSFSYPCQSFLCMIISSPFHRDGFRTIFQLFQVDFLMDHPQAMNLTEWCILVCSAADTAKECCPLDNAVCYDKCPAASSDMESSPLRNFS